MSNAGLMTHISAIPIILQIARVFVGGKKIKLSISAGFIDTFSVATAFFPGWIIKYNNYLLVLDR